ncbi:rod shape-determining protein MreC [Sessilibacter corallicola]|uniref:rod shape-determining protein MreC n=1 Tax=Sessilibacter corallicola TaxID=2904075 RepID=UPI00257363B8|nr:rod shape-determining protein MreC [Sessilibacter corallicola]
MFSKGSSTLSRLTLWVMLLTVVIVLLDVFTPYLKPVKSQLSTISVPFYWVTNIPSRISEWGQDNLVTREQLLDENRALKEQLLIHQRRLQGMAAVVTENVRLRELMNSAEMVAEQVLVAEMIGVSSDPLVHKVVINKGSRDNVYIGQPLLDAQGLMGQVVEVGPFSSQVLLITDSTHALPVEVNRNGVRAIVEGIGDLYRMELRHVSNTVDIEVGDLLVSSGLGQKFPRGYPVGTVTEIIHDPGRPFAGVHVEPMAQLNRSRHVLLVFRDSSTAPEDVLTESDLSEVR